MRRSTSRINMVALLCAGAVGLTACGNSDSSDDPTVAQRGAGESPATAAGPTGWPQATDGVIDEKMCGLLTGDDFAKYKVITGKVETLPFQVNAEVNGIGCNYSLDDRMGLALGKTDDEARLLYADSTSSSSAKSGKENVVTGADQSIAYLDGEEQAYVVSRRGRLIVRTSLDSLLSEISAQERLDGAVALNALVLERAPQLGKA
ncbi:hypothetical protein [Plantactinospora sp. GCM10030261]|uniref:hypothetical protein n=1 Tax=Plantactinospora sp. GCM10030261 TaxID=3273420 RepID=UPI00362168AB